MVALGNQFQLQGEGMMGSVAFRNYGHVEALPSSGAHCSCGEANAPGDRRQHQDVNLPSRIVRAVQAARLRRAALFDSSLFSDPAWDILLELYALHVEQRRASVSSVYAASSVPASTALRWVAKLEHDGLVTRSEDPTDARRSWIDLTADGRERMRRFFEMLPLAMASV